MDGTQLERRKLELEVKKLQTPWWRNIEFWKVLIPTIAVLATLYFTFGKGIMDREKSKLELQKEQLKLDILQFTVQKKTIEDTIKKIIADKVFFQQQVDSLLNRKDSLTSQTQHLSIELAKQLAANNSLKKLYEEDKSFYEGQLNSMYELEKKYLTDLDVEKSKRRQQETAAASAEARYQFLLTRAKLTDIEKIDLNLAGLGASSKVSKRHSDELKSELNALDKKYQNADKMFDTMSHKQIQRWFETEFRRFRD